MRRRLAVAAVLVALGATAVAIADAASVRVGTLVLRADGRFEPRTLPRRHFAPIRFQGYGAVRTTDGSQPPPLEHVKVEFDRDGRLATAGLPRCAPARIESATPRQARARCAGAIVGRGRIAAAATLPGLGRVALRSPLTVFNGPRRGGHPTALLHARAPRPVGETYVIVAPIERRGGQYRYRTEFDLPAIAGGLGSLTRIEARVGRRWRFHGRERSYVSARCSDYVLQTQGYFRFGDEQHTVIYGSVFKGCTPRL